MNTREKQNPIASPFEVSDSAIIDYLGQAQAKGTDDFLGALSEVVKNKGMEKVANDAGLNRISLYRSLKAGALPRYETIDKILDSLGISLQLTMKL